MITLPTEEFVLPDPQTPLKFAFKRYLAPAQTKRPPSAQQSVALILVHCVSTHKETWEPILSDLFQLQNTVLTDVYVSEAWVLDSPNHGHAAILNEHELLERPSGTSAYDWARGVGELLRTDLVGPRIRVAVGHSAGSATLILSTKSYALDSLPFASMVVIEPGLMTRAVFEHAFKDPSLMEKVIAQTKLRKEFWPSRAASAEWFAKRLPWQRWDPRVRALFVEHALRELPTATYPDKPAGSGVTRAVTREQDTSSYLHFDDAFDALDRLSELCSALPVHAVLGTEIDIVARETTQGCIDPAQGRRMTTITRVQGAGHLVVQENPVGTALAIWRALNHARPATPERTKL